MSADEKARERSLIGQLGAYARIAKHGDTTTKNGLRAANVERFERLVDPDGTLPPAERAKRATAARKAHMTRLALKSAQARRRRASR